MFDESSIFTVIIDVLIHVSGFCSSYSYTINQFDTWRYAHTQRLYLEEKCSFYDSENWGKFTCICLDKIWNIRGYINVQHHSILLEHVNPGICKTGNVHFSFTTVRSNSIVLKFKRASFVLVHGEKFVYLCIFFIIF